MITKIGDYTICSDDNIITLVNEETRNEFYFIKNKIERIFYDPDEQEIQLYFSSGNFFVINFSHNNTETANKLIEIKDILISFLKKY